MKEEHLVVNFAEMTDDELFSFREWLSTEREKINDEWAEIAGQTIGYKEFDPYTFSGEKKIKKLVKIYSEKTSGIDYLQELLVQEIDKRHKFKEEQKYSGTGAYRSLTEREKDSFMEKEQLKTKTYRAKYK